MATDRRVLLLATGDTIAQSPGRAHVAGGAELVAGLPAGCAGATVTVHDVPAPPSWDTSASTMLALARRVRTAILDDGFDGVVVTHGVDTVEETAYLVDLLAGDAAGRGGIVLTGATRTADELSSDGPGNLAAALAAAADPATRGLGALVCAADELHAARWVSVVDAASVVPLSSAPYPPVGRVVGGRVEPFGAPPPRPPVAVGDPEPDVALIKTYPDMPAALLASVVDAGARGVVLEGTGTGNVPVGLFTAIDELTGWDIPVVVASRCRTHAWADPSPVAGLAVQVGAVSARGLPPAKARVALMVALGGGGVDAVRDWFARLR